MNPMGNHKNENKPMVPNVQHCQYFLYNDHFFGLCQSFDPTAVMRVIISLTFSAVFDVCFLFQHYKSYFLANDFNTKFSKLVRQVEESGG